MASRIETPHAFVVKYDGSIVGMNPSQDRENDAELWDALDQGWHSGALHLQDATYQAVSAEIRAPNLIGWLVIGRRLDKNEMSEISQLSSVPVRARIVRQVPDGGWVFDATGQHLREGNALALLEEMSLMTDGMPNALSKRVGGTMVLVRPLGSTNGSMKTAMMLEFSVASAMAEYDPLRWAVAIAGFFGLALVAVSSMMLARTIVRPIHELQRAVRKLEAGEVSYVTPKGGDEIVERERQIRHLAYHDALTGLPNRHKLSEDLDAMIAHQGDREDIVGLLCIGLDDFKIVNDTLGHDIGDKVLKTVSLRLQELAEDRHLSRIGGDQFCLILQGRAGSSEFGEFPENVIAVLGSGVQIEGHHVVARASIGIAQAPRDGNTANDLIKRAELAMFKAKERGSGIVRDFDESFDALAHHRRTIEIDMHTALEEGQFVLYFQPLFDLASNRFSAFEALVRWRHPVRGLIPPAEFIPIAEETGLIVPLGEWVLKEACRHAANWPEHIKVAVNFSTVQFNSPGIKNLVFQTLAVTGLDAKRLEIEITESIFLENAATVLETLYGLKALGVRIAMDDFGTGYSSLSYLRKFPFDKIKIDRSFIIELLNEADASAVVKAIVQLASALNMETTAEGVEEPDQVEVLRKHGCTTVQGYFFSKPVPGEDVSQLLEDDRRRRAA